MQPLPTSLQILEVRDKIRNIEWSCRAALERQNLLVPETPGRDLEVRAIKDLPAKAGFSTPSGQARMLHDLASIELQAMELGLRTLMEFPDAPMAFRQRLAEITIEESQHLSLCLDGIEALGFRWGDWPVHLGLWRCVSPEDHLLDRVLMVHRFLEGSGLDAGETLRRRLSGVKASLPKEIAQRIADEEISHVQFGSEWYRELCRMEKLDSVHDFEIRMGNLFSRLPRRLEPIARGVRAQAGFSEREMDLLEDLRKHWLAPTDRIHGHHPEGRPFGV